MTSEEIKKMGDIDLLELEHDTSYDCIKDLSGSLKFFELLDKVKKEVDFRELKPLPRLFNVL